VVGLVHLYLVAVAISLDTFAAALALGTRTAPSGWLRVAAVFAVSGGLFPVIGMWIGLLASGLLTQVAGGVGALVLAGLGGWFLHGALTGGDARIGVPAAPKPAALPRYEPLPELAPGTPPDLLVGRAPPVPIRAVQAELPLGGLVLLAMGLSSDNLLVGLGLGLQGGTTVLLGVLTAFSVFCATLTGLWLGRLKKLWFGRAAEGLAGVLLLGLAAYLLLAGR
jgi:manganese efflux pump family protein